MQNNDCNSPIHPKAEQGLRLFNEGKYFEAHEQLEDAWNAESSSARELYRGVLQVAVTYLHISRGNYIGAKKVYQRSMKWLERFPNICKGINVEKLRIDARFAIENINPPASYDLFFLKPIQWGKSKKHIYFCDKCGNEMYEKNCKISCPNCGNRFDCSDLNIYFD